MATRSKLVVEAAGALVGVFLITIGYTVARPLVLASRMVPLIILFELSLYAVLVGFIVAVNMLAKRGQREGLGFRWRPPGRQLLIGLAIFALTISFIVAALLLGAGRTDVLSFKARSGWVLLYYAVHGFLFVGLGEELVWRGYFFERTKEITGSRAWAVVLPALLFGLWHYPNGQNTLQVLATAALGMIYGFARWKARDCSTMATGIAHGLHDTAIVILSYFLL